MSQAVPDVVRIPSGVTLTKRGERYLKYHPKPSPAGRSGALPAAPSARRGACGALRRRRAQAEAMIDRLLSAVEDLLLELDAIDGDENLEDGGDDEPSLGSVAVRADESQAGWAAGDRLDLEDDFISPEERRA